MADNYFKNLLILDHTRYLLGGYATQVFADLGAEVIKIENIDGGDFCRMEEPMRNGVSHYFSALNRNKKSLTLNLKSEEGRKIYLDLVKKADVVIETFRPGVMKRLGIDYEAEESVNPRIIHCAMSSFGQDNPRSLKAFHDINFQALSGYLSLNGGVISPIHYVDVATGMAAVQNIMAALLERTHSGKGSFCDVRMFDSFVWWNSLIDARYDFYDGKVSKETLDFPALAYNIYETADGGRVAVGMLEEKFWNTFLKDFGLEDLAKFKRCRRQEAAEAFEKMEKTFKKYSTAEWNEYLSSKDTCAMTAFSKDEAINYIISSDTGLMKYVDFNRTGKTLQTRIPLHVSSLPFSLDSATECPALGEHNTDILLDAGYTDDEIADLRNKGIIGSIQ
jgi:crotonobetainyl-CoA:carnitine CoA-transferase CaiB-like acyl-CoA transferase